MNITRVVDARAGQDRVMLHLECRHVVSLSTATLQQMSTELVAALGLRITPATMKTWPCELCEDLPLDKSATQLWKEAGEP